MSGPRRMDPDAVAYCLRVAKECGAPESSRHLAGHIAALEQDLAAAEARGFERARDMAVTECVAEAKTWGNATPVVAANRCADRIRAMQDGQGRDGDIGPCARCGGQLNATQAHLCRPRP